MNKDEFAKYVEHSSLFDPFTLERLTIKNISEPYYRPHIDLDTKDLFLASSIDIQVEDEECNHVHNVVFAYTQEQGLSFWCGDGFIEGSGKRFGDPKTANETMADVISRYDDFLTDSDEIKNSMIENCHNKAESDHCDFWTIHMSESTLSEDGVKKICDHVAKAIEAKQESVFDELKSHYSQAFEAKDKQSLDYHVKFLDHYKFRKHILIEGTKGSGKTVLASKYIDQNALNHEFIAGFDGMESIDMLGYNVRYQVGDKETIIWQDKALSAAFRKASNGVPTVLFFDEMLRTPPRQLSLLVGALTPDHKGNYSLRTGRITGIEDGVAQEEVLVAPQDMLWVVATTNVGSAYNVDEIESALADRFMLVRKDSDIEMVEKILEEQCKKRRFSSKAVKNMMALYKHISNLFVQNIITNDINLRHICEIVQFTKSEVGLHEEAVNFIPKWAGRDLTDPNGQIVPSQVESITEVLSAIFD